MKCLLKRDFWCKRIPCFEWYLLNKILNQNVSLVIFFFIKPIWIMVFVFPEICVYRCFVFIWCLCVLMTRKWFFVVFCRMMINNCFLWVWNLGNNREIKNITQKSLETRARSTGCDCVCLEMYIHCSLNLTETVRISIEIKSGFKYRFAWWKNYYLLAAQLSIIKKFKPKIINELPSNLRFN